jgi:hypothetical protein
MSFVYGPDGARLKKIKAATWRPRSSRERHPRYEECARRKVMTRSEEEFVALLVSHSLELKAANQKVFAAWQPSIPPVTMIFEALGEQIVDQFDSLAIDIKSQIFVLIENAMKSTDTQLKTSVATGLLEAMVGHAEQSDGLWDRIVPFMGWHSRHHAEAWLNWGSGDGAS